MGDINPIFGHYPVPVRQMESSPVSLQHVKLVTKGEVLQDECVV